MSVAYSGSPLDPLPPGCHGARDVTMDPRLAARARVLAARLPLWHYQDELVGMGEPVRFYRFRDDEGEGIGAVVLDALGDVTLQDITSTPEGAQAWNTITSQLSSEGGTALDRIGAQQAFVNSFDQLTGQFGVDPSTALDAAKQFTLQAQTIAGAVGQVMGLIAAANDPSANQEALATNFLGTVMALAVAAGLSAGVGAAIVAAVAALSQVLESAGLIPTPPQGATIPGCAGRVHIPQPTPPSVVVIGCVVGQYNSVSQSQIASPKSPGWRRFPEPSPYPTLGAGDNGWFIANTPGSTRTPLTWNGGTWGGDGDARMVDLAWPQYHHLECETQHYMQGPPGDFERAFYAAWKLNQEMALNGQRPATDWQVLLRTIEVWNRAHAAGTTYTFPPAKNGGGTDTDFMPAGTDCARFADYGPYVSYLAQDLANHSGAGQPTTVTINTGTLHPRSVGNCTLFGTCGQTSTGMSTGGKIATGAVVAAGAVTAAWLALGRPMSVEAAKYAASRLVAKVKG